MTIFNLFMLTTIVLIKNKHTVFTEAALWPVPSAPPCLPAHLHPRIETENKEKRPSITYWLREPALESAL